MKYNVLSCDFCGRFYAFEDIICIEADYSSEKGPDGFPPPMRLIKQVDNYYIGIRKLCRFCCEQIKSLEVQNAKSKPVTTD